MAATFEWVKEATQVFLKYMDPVELDNMYMELQRIPSNNISLNETLRRLRLELVKEK
jgi:hypothetical protein